MIYVALFAMLLLSGCVSSGGTKKSYTSGISMGEEGTSALYIYMCGSTLESSSGAAVKNLKELLAVDFDENTQVVIETGGSSKWRKYGISSSSLSRYTVENNELVLVEEKENASMGDPKTLSDFLNWCVKNYPAQNMSVLFWNHGSGSLSGICFDENYEMDSLSLTELDQALDAVRSNMTDSFEWIGFDACLMADYETASVIAKYADTMIASQELEPSGGWDYATMEYLGQDEFYEKLLQGYQEKCEAKGRENYTLSAVNLENFDDLSALMDDLGSSLLEESKTGLQQVVLDAQECMKFGSNTSTEGYSNRIDLADFARARGNIEIEELLKQMAISVAGSQKESASGMSVYYPVSSIDDVSLYLENAPQGQYRSFVQSVYGSVDSSKDLIEFISSTDDNGELKVTLSDASIPYIANVEYQVYINCWLTETGENVLVSLGRDNEFVIISDTEYRTDFDGIWLGMEGEWMQIEDVDCIGTLTTFSSPIKVNGQEASLRFVYDASDGSCVIQGYILQSDTKEASRLEDFQNGDTVVLMHEMLDTDDCSTWFEGTEFVWSDDSAVTLDVIEEGYYETQVIVTDIFGREYLSSVACLELKEDGTASIYQMFESREDLLKALADPINSQQE